MADQPVGGCPAQEGEAAGGSAASLRTSPSGYPHVVYYCANTIDIAPSNLWCYRSLDGGQSFGFTGAFPDPALPAGCTEDHPSRPGVAGPDGVLYFPTELCGALGVAISHDEGASWRFRPIVGTGLEDIYTSGTAADSRGNLYFAWRGPGALPYLSTSTDGGATWNRPLMVAPPGVRAVRRVAVAVRKRGEVALSYLGTTDGARFNGYITESRNVLAQAAPLLERLGERPCRAVGRTPRTPRPSATASSTARHDRRHGTVWAGFHWPRPAPAPAGGSASSAG